MSNMPHYVFSEEEVVNYIIKNKASIRETATHFGCGRDVISRKIKSYNGAKKEELEKVLQDNLKKSRF